MKCKNCSFSLVYLRAVKLAEIATGIRMDYNWMDTTLRKRVEDSSLCGINLKEESQELRDRISRGEFDPTEEEKIKLVELFPELEKSLDEVLTNMYGFVYSTLDLTWYD